MIEVVIMTPEKILFEGRAQFVIVPGEKGVFEIRPFHKPIISRLVPGKVLVDDHIFDIEHGIIKVEDNKVSAMMASTTQQIN